NVVVVAEQRLVLQGEFPCLLRSVGKEKTGQLSRNARRKANQPFRVLLQSFKIYSRLVVETFHKGNGIKTAQVVVAGVVFGKQNEVVVLFVFVPHIVQVFAHIKLAPDDG